MALAATGALLGVGGMAWWGQSAAVRFLVREGVAARWPLDVLFVLDWAVMCAAMMLPTTLPLMAAAQRAWRGRQDAIRLLTACLLGYLAVWVLSGVVVRALHLTVFDALARWPQVRGQGAWWAGGLLVAGGLYLQLPVAHRCVTACRSPLGFIARHWTGVGRPAAQALRIGTAYGLSCFGCCWPLMLAMAGLGLGDPLWMLAATGVMAWQKHGRHGEGLMRALGVAGLLLGLGLWAGGLPVAWVAPAWSPDGLGACITR